MVRLSDHGFWRRLVHHQLTSGTDELMRYGRLIALLLACAALVVLVAASGAGSSSRVQRVFRGCPGRFADYVRPTSLDSVVAVARRVAIDHVISHYQGRAVRRTVADYPVLEVVLLGQSARTTGCKAADQPQRHANFHRSHCRRIALRCRLRTRRSAITQ